MPFMTPYLTGKRVFLQVIHWSVNNETLSNKYKDLLKFKEDVFITNYLNTI